MRYSRVVLSFKRKPCPKSVHAVHVVALRFAAWECLDLSDDEGDLRAAMSKRVKESAGSSLSLGKKLADAMDRNDDGAETVDIAAEEKESSATEVCSSLRAGGTAP